MNAACGYNLNQTRTKCRGWYCVTVQGWMTYGAANREGRARANKRFFAMANNRRRYHWSKR